MSETHSSDWPQVERALAEALDRPPAEQPDFVESLPPSIRDEVASLLAASARAQNFLEPPSVPASPLKERAPLQPGTQIGIYEIEGTIGSGGMGVVYRARDSRLNRPVAVKFLFDDVADRAACLRFQREAQMASSLNHPHIVAVYDIGEFEGSQYMVTEFIDGGTLNGWARAQKRTWREIAGLLVGVADGLAAAHQVGILHRDIKPENILVGSNGYAKLADFGIAKLQQLDDEPAPVPAPSLTAASTLTGGIIGTIAYMSPEQASGRSVDARSDIFSFGVMLYELLAGRKPFQGDTDREMLESIARNTAPELPAAVPLALRMAIEKAVEKEPADRYQGIRDLVVDLRRLLRRGDDTPPTAAPMAHSRWHSAPATAFGAVFVMVALAAFLWLRRPATDPRAIIQFDIPAPPGTLYAPTISRQSFAISPDGTKLVLVATGSDGTHVWLRALAEPDMRRLPGTDGAWSVFWRPDSQSIYYSVGPTLKQIDLNTGGGRVVAELPDIPQFATWRSPEVVSLYYGGGGMIDLRLTDGALQNAVQIDGIRWPQYLPGGRRILYSVYDAQQAQSRVFAADYPKGQPVPLVLTDSRAGFAPSPASGSPGQLVFIRGGSLLAQPFDADHLRTVGEPLPLAQNAIYFGPNLSASFSLSETGLLVYQANFPLAELKWYDRSGKEVGAAGPPSQYWGNVRLSPDGRRVAAPVWSAESGAPSVWASDADGGQRRRLTFPPDVYLRPVWSPDGAHLVVGRSARVGPPYPRIVDSGAGASQLDFEPNPQAHLVIPTDWSSDGRFIVFDDGVGEEQHTIWIGDAASRKLQPFLDEQAAHWGAAFSPSGDQIAFASLESGRPEVYLQGFEPSPVPHLTGERRVVSKNGAWLVRWRSDGKELFFLGLDNVMHAVQVSGKLQFGAPSPLFRIPGISQYGTSRDFQFDVAPNGQRFVIPTTGAVSPPPFTVVENWQSKVHP